MYEDGAGTRHRLGTLPYMAPEVLRGEPGDARSDQWSFCVALWHTLEAALPYEGETATGLLAEIERDEP
jgi:serine/threonine protein kinase